MNKTPTKKPGRNKATQAKFDRELAKFKKFVAYYIQELEAGKSLIMIVNVVKDPCAPKRQFFASMHQGPPDRPV